MSTIAAIGVGQPNDWAGTLVTTDGYPSALGRELLNLVVELGGDLEATWSYVSSPAYGWAAAFEAVREEPGFLQMYCSGEGPTLVRHDSALVRGRDEDGARLVGLGPAYWYLLDVAQRTLSVYEAPSVLSEGGEPRLMDRARFDEAGIATFEVSSEDEDSDDWRQRRRDYGSDHITRTAAAVTKRLGEALPIVGSQLALCLVEPPHFTDGGLVVPLQAHVSQTVPLAERIEDIVEHRDLTLLAGRLLRDEARCLRFIDTALAELRRLAVSGEVPTYLSPQMFKEQLFPVSLLDLEISDDELATRTRTGIRESFEPA